MASLKDRLNDLKQEKQTVEEIRDALRETFDADRRRTRSLKESRDLQFQILEINKNIEKVTNITKEQKKLGLEKQIKNLKSSGLNSLNKQLGLEKQIELLTEKAAKGTEEQVEHSKKYAKLLGDVSSGAKDLEDVLNDIVNEDFGEMLPFVEKIAETLRDTPDLAKKLKIEKEAQDRIDDFQKKITDVTDLLSSPKAMGVASVTFLGKQFFDIASSANQIRQDLGLSVSESASLGAKTTILSKAFSLLGADGEQIAAFSKAVASEFGSINELSFSTLKNFGMISLRTGISGDNAAKLAKSIQSIQGGTLETSLNTISTFESLSRAAGVAPKLVLDDIAESTELFAKFAKDGGDNLAKAAIEARKLGLSLSVVDKISESILDFESSIEKQMEASVLLGRQLNLDKARELALTGDLEGLMKEVKNQAGGAAAFSQMDVMQRKALADAIGIEVSELSKLAAGQNNVNKAAQEQFASQVKTFMTIAGIATILGGIVGMITGGAALGAMARGAGKGILIGGGIGIAGGVAAGAAQGMLPKAQTGGVVRETGMAVVHKGETIAGTQFGGRESNKLLKQMIEQNATLMNRLTNKVGDLALGS